MEPTLYKNESEDLELHVSICQERYKQLDDRMARVEQDLTEVKQQVKDSNASIRTTIITTTGTILVAIIAVIGTILAR
jgi:energy-converting hydrogenase Eha subunit F